MAGGSEPAFICLECAGKARDEPLPTADPALCGFCGREGRIAASNDKVALCEGCIEVCLEVSAPFVIKP